MKNAPMWFRFGTIAALGLLAVLALPSLLVAGSKGNCTLPDGLREEVAAKYPGTHVVQLGDLSDYDRKLYRRDHDDRCPGLVKVNFYGDGKPTWAVVLTAGEHPHRRVTLLVARQLADGWALRSLEQTDGAPVVWREGPGKYEGMNETKPLRARYPVIIFCDYGSWSVLYAWTGSEVKKIWLTD